MSGFIDLGAGDELVGPAIALSRVRQVSLRPATADAAAELSAHGFVAAASGFHVIACRSTLTAHPSRLRQLRAQQERLDHLDLRVTVSSGASLASRIEDLYMTLIAPWVYGRGRSPHGVHWLPQFRRLVSMCVGVVGTDADGRTLAASFYRIRTGAGFALAPASGAAGRVAVGAVEVVHPDLGEVGRAWRAMTVDAVGGLGVSHVSLGADDCIIDAGYVPVVLDKLRWYRAVAWQRDVRPRFVSLGTTGRPDRFPLVIGTTDTRPTFSGAWQDGAAHELRSRIDSLTHENG
jgi:hypothetical protein